MTMEIFKLIIETFSAFAVVYSLLHVAKQVRASTEQTISNRIGDNMMTGSSSSIGAIIVKGISGSAQLNDEEEARFVFFISGWLRTLEQAHRQYKKGYLDKTVWTGYEEYLKTILPSNRVQEYWKERNMIFNEDFRKLIDEMNVNLNPTDFGIRNKHI